MSETPEDREIGDYEIDVEIVEERARQRVNDAEKFVQRIEKYLQRREINGSKD